MFCPKCGIEAVMPDAKFCHACGFKMSTLPDIKEDELKESKYFVRFLGLPEHVWMSMISILGRLIVVCLLFWASSRHSYGYYVFLRYITTGVSIYCAWLSHSLNKIPWVWLFAFLALLFNPLVPIRLDRTTWGYLDIAVGIVFLVSIYFVRESFTNKRKLQR